MSPEKIANAILQAAVLICLALAVQTCLIHQQLGFINDKLWRLK